MKILFMGTPDFAVFSLRALVEAGENVIGVLTQPDKPKGRGYNLMPSPVKVYATEQNIPIFQPVTLRDGAFADQLESLNPDIIVVVAYGKILPKYVLDYPKHGCINIHGSLLPKYRGAAPMQRAIMEGEKLSGITSMYMAEGLDTGDMLLTSEVEIAEEDNFENVHDNLGLAGAKTLLETIALAKVGKLVPIKQDDSLATYAHKIEKEECLIDLSNNAKVLHDKIRGMSPFPLAYTILPNGKKLKIVKATYKLQEHNYATGEVVSLDKNGVKVAVGGGFLILITMFPEGKKAQSASDMINGRQIHENDILGKEV